MEFTDEEMKAIEHFKEINSLYRYNVNIQYTDSEYDYSKILLDGGNDYENRGSNNKSPTR